ncbi:uncharacterized protein LOC131929284 [Physella acuta]|uniref:uncharacterized protein LOC131929284 n=1 Tax=Physella acuta TaxID=109671 RepID=UPI0027DB261F|nr:uncharacterized protein LOC131929284 [Physella acuta]
MVVSYVLDLLILLLIEVAHLVSSDMTYCPRSLYDCDSLDTVLHNSIDAIITPEFMSSVHEDSGQIDELCKFIKSPECSEPIVSQCKGEIIYAIQAFKSRQQYICGERFTRKGISDMPTCVRTYQRNFAKCKRTRAEKLEQDSYMTQAPTSPHPWCNYTNEYIECVFTIMSFGCTMKVANKYFEQANQSSPVIDAIYRYGCSFSHPLDILKTTSPTTETTSPMHGPHSGYTYRRPNQGYYNRANGQHQNSHIINIMCCLCLYVLLRGQGLWRIDVSWRSR